MTNSICCRPIIERCQSDVKRLYASRVTIVRLLTDSSETDRWPSLHLLLLSLHIMPICNQLIDDRWDKISLFKDSCNSITDTVYLQLSSDEKTPPNRTRRQPTPKKTYFYRRSGSVKYCANQGEGQKLKYSVRIMALLCFGKLLISLINTSFKLAGYLVDIKRST